MSNTKKTTEVPGKWQNDGTVVIQFNDSEVEHRIPGDVYNYITSLEYEMNDPSGYVAKSKNVIQGLAQSVADLSAMMMPMSGLTMMMLMQQAQAAAKHIGVEKIEPSEMAHQGTVNMINIVRKPIQADLDKMSLDVKKVYDYAGPLYIVKDGNQVCIATFDTFTIAPPEWPAKEFVFADNITLGLAKLALLQGWKLCE